MHPVAVLLQVVAAMAVAGETTGGTAAAIGNWQQQRGRRTKMNHCSRHVRFVSKCSCS